MPADRPLTTDHDLLEWAGSELAAIDTGVPGTLTVHLAAARVWRLGEAGFWPGWRLTLSGAQVLEATAPWVGAITEGQWTPAGRQPQARWDWAAEASGPGLLTLQLRQGGRLVVRAESWAVHAPPERPWREDWSC